MTDPVKVAIVIGISNILVVMISRLWSHFEHKGTNDTVNRIERKMNGDGRRIDP